MSLEIKRRKMAKPLDADSAKKIAENWRTSQANKPTTTPLLQFRMGQPLDADPIKKRDITPPSEATGNDQSAPKVTTEDGKLMRLPVGKKNMDALHRARTVEVENANAQTTLIQREHPTGTIRRQEPFLSQAEQLAESLGLELSRQPTDDQIDAVVQSLTQGMDDENDKEVVEDRAQLLKTYLHLTNPDRYDEEAPTVLMNTHSQEQTSGDTLLNKENNQLPESEMIDMDEAIEIRQLLGLTSFQEATDAQIDAAVQSLTQGMDEGDKKVIEDKATLLKVFMGDDYSGNLSEFQETIDQMNAEKEYLREIHRAKPEKNETNDRLLQAEQLAQSFGLKLSEKLTDSQIDAAVQSLTQGMDDEDDKEVVEDRAQLLKSYLNNINPERQPSADALNQGIATMDGPAAEVAPSQEKSAETTMNSQQELLDFFGFEPNQTVTGQQILDRAREIAEDSEPGKDTQKVYVFARELIDLLRGIPVIREKAAYSPSKESTEEPTMESMDQYVWSQKDEEAKTADTPETDAAVSEKQEKTPRPVNIVFRSPAERRREKAEKKQEKDRQDATKSNETTWESAEANDLKNAKKRLEEISAEVKELNGFLAELQQKEGVLARAARKLSEFMRIGQAPLPDGKVRTAAELKESETKITAVEDALNHNLQALERVQAKVERMTKKSVEQARLDLVKAQNAMEKASEQPKENGRESLQVRGLSAEALAASKKAAVEKFYEAVGMEIPVEQKSYIQNIAEMLGVSEYILDGRLPTAKVGLRELNAARQEALFKKEEELKQQGEGAEYAENQMVAFQKYLQEQGIDLEDPNVIAGLEQARQAFQNEAIQQKLSPLDLELRALMDEVIVHDKAETRLRILEQLGIKNTARVGFSKPDLINAAINSRLLKVENPKEKRQLEHILRSNGRLLKRLEQDIVRFEKQNDDAEQTETAQQEDATEGNLLPTQSLEDDKILQARKRAQMIENFKQLPSLTDANTDTQGEKNRKQWGSMLEQSESLKKTIAFINDKVKDYDFTDPKLAETSDFNVRKKTDPFSIKQMLMDVGPDPKKIPGVIAELNSSMSNFLSAEIITQVQPQLEDELIRIYNVLTKGEIITGETLNSPDQLNAWENAKKDEVVNKLIHEHISVLAELFPKGVPARDPEHIYKLLLDQPNIAKINEGHQRLKRMIQFSIDRNRPAAETALADLMKVINNVYQAAELEGTKLEASDTQMAA